MRNIEKRLQGLEKHLGNEIIVIVEIDGVQSAMSAKEYAKTDGAIFKRVQSGSRLSDLDIISEKMLGWSKI